MKTLAALALVAVAAPAGESDAIIAARRAGERLSFATLGSIRGAIDRGIDVKTQRYATRSIAIWARALPSMYPPGSDTGATDALPAVWSDRAGFDKAAATYLAAANKLAALAASGEATGFAAQWAETRAACNACHVTYRRPRPDA